MKEICPNIWSAETAISNVFAPSVIKIIIVAFGTSRSETAAGEA